MASSAFSIALVFALFVATFDMFTCLEHTLEASVTCLDCDNHHFDYSGIEVAVKCDKVGKLSVAGTEPDGSFSIELPSVSAPQSCLAKIMGGPSQLYVPKSNQVSQVHNELNSYSLSTPLVFYTKPPSSFGSSKTVDIPLPPEWGLAPSSYYFPFFPIIGIP